MNRRKEKTKDLRGQARDGLMTGRLRIARNGAGYVVDPKTDEAIWIEKEDLDTALPGDTVSIRPVSKPHGRPGKSGRNARVAAIVARAERAIVGTVTDTGRFWRVRPLLATYRQEFTVPAFRKAKIGDRVVMRLVRWKNPRLAPEGEITDVIGPADNPSLDTRSILETYELPDSFPPPVLAAAEEVSAFLKQPGRRLDLRKKFIFTCDPETAKDFDDALSLETDAQGRRVLGVHIADVSHFVRPGSPLDREARKRSTSVYLVDKVVPMLPEQLSNGVCSLVPGEDRLAFSVFMTFDERGKCVARSFAKSVIRSKARFCYEEVMAIIRGAKKHRAAKTILALNALAQTMRKARFAAGALDMEVPEAEVVLDDKGMMTGLRVRPYDESHQLVEECMVAANEAVAAELWTRGIKILARLHESPDPAKIEELQANLQGLGLKTGNLASAAGLAKFLRRLKGSALEPTVSMMVLRAMKRACYSSTDIGHFGLAKTYYAHFTSPIRRYPDLTLHRQLADFLVAPPKARRDKAEMARLAEWTSEREQVADEAERALVEIKKYRFLEAQVKSTPLGKRPVYEAVVGKVTPYGLFVDVPELAVGGMVHVSNLADAYVAYDELRQEMRAGRETWSVGGTIRVRVLAVDFDERHLDFISDAKRG